MDMGLFAKAKATFLRGLLKLENGVPSDDTQPAFPHARSGAVPGGVSAVHGRLLRAMQRRCGDRRQSSSASGKSPLHMVSAWGCEQRLMLAQTTTEFS